MLQNIRSKIKNCDPIDYSDALDLMSYNDRECLELFALANSIRSKSETG